MAIKEIRIALLGLIVLILIPCMICGLIRYNYSIPVQEEAAPHWSPDGQSIAYVCYVEGPTSRIAEDNGYHYTAEAADICIIGAVNIIQRSDLFKC